MTDLLTAFRTLGLPVDDRRFSAVPIDGYARHRIAKNRLGEPHLLILPSERSSSVPPAAISLEHLRIVHNVPCVITRPDGTEERGIFTIVGCMNSDDVLQEYFLRTLGAILPVLGQTPSVEQISRTLQKVVELFRLMGEVARTSIQGLWAELFVIRQGSEVAEMAEAWHGSPEELFDFNAGEQRIEVKSASGRERVHHFRFEQLHPPTGAEVVIASVLVNTTGGGTSMGELIGEIRGILNQKHDLIARLDRIVVQSLGSGWHEALEARFDRQLAAASLAFFWAEDIPGVPSPPPVGVSEIRFKADLGMAKPIDRKELESRGAIFKAVLPRPYRPTIGR